MGKSQAVRIVKEFVNALKREGIKVDRVILYGSHVKGNVRPDSDFCTFILASCIFSKISTASHYSCWRFNVGGFRQEGHIPLNLQAETFNP